MLTGTSGRMSQAETIRMSLAHSSLSSGKQLSCLVGSLYSVMFMSSAVTMSYSVSAYLLGAPTQISLIDEFTVVEGDMICYLYSFADTLLPTTSDLHKYNILHELVFNP